RHTSSSCAGPPSPQPSRQGNTSSMTTRIVFATKLIPLNGWMTSKETAMKWLRGMILGVVMATGVASPLAVPTRAEAQFRQVYVYDVWFYGYSPNTGLNQWFFSATYEGPGDATRAINSLKASGYPTWWAGRWVAR